MILFMNWCSARIRLRDNLLAADRGGIMDQLTELGKTIVATDPDKIRLDQAVKNILAYKPLLARIFREVVQECRDMEADEIESCIEGEVLISKVYVDSGLTNAGERIDGLSTEAYLNEEGLDRFDI